MILILRAGRTQEEDLPGDVPPPAVGFQEISILALQRIPGVYGHVMAALAKAPETGTWLVFTSGNAVRFLLDALDEDGQKEEGLRRMASHHIAGLGKGTAQALEREGIRVALVPEREIPEGLAESLKSRSAARVIWPCNSARGKDLRLALEARGMDVLEIPVYEEVRDEGRMAEAISLVRSGQVQALGFTSRNLVFAFGDALRKGTGPLVRFPEGLSMGAIGQTTAEAIRYTFPSVPVHVASRPDVRELVQLLSKVS